MKTPHKLQLSIKAIRAIQKAHKIENLLQPSEADSKKFATLDFLVGFYHAGTRYLGDEAPSMDDIEEMNLTDLLGAVQAFMKGSGEGKD